MSTKFSMVATTLYGLEQVLAKELENMGATEIVVKNRAVEFKGNQACMYRANMSCRTALRILLPIGNFKAFKEEHLYKRTKEIDWSKHIRDGQSFAINGVVHSKIFKHSAYAGLKVKDAIVDQFRDKTGERPNVNPKRPDVLVVLHIDKEYVKLLLDTSGKPLHMRGYRLDAVQAPISEVLAAGILQLSSWEGQSDFLDPMCGSGTFCIEAALMAMNKAPNLARKHFNFMGFADYDPDLLMSVKESLIKEEKAYNHTIYGLDISKEACGISRSNVMRIGLSRAIKIQCTDFFNYKPNSKKHHIVFNPPYGNRLRINPKAFHSDIGDAFKQKYSGCKAWLISSDIEHIKYIGLKPSKKTKLINGKLECRLLEFEMYEGSKKRKNQKEETL